MKKNQDGSPKSSMIDEKDQETLYEIIGRTAARNSNIELPMSHDMKCHDACRAIINYLEKVEAYLKRVGE